MKRATWIFAAGLGAGCITVDAVRADLSAAEAAISEARALRGETCSPAVLAHAEAQARFTRLEASQGNLPRAGRHAHQALEFATQARNAAEACSRVDTDQDGVIDSADACPTEAEDRDNVRDDDGCEDLDPLGDKDGDGIPNIDDGLHTDADGDAIGALVDLCPTRPEDRDGWEDDDGCPDPDDDGDGIADAEDRCPMTRGERLRNGCPAIDADRDGVTDADDRCPQAPETPNRYRDGDGCPDAAPPQATIDARRIETLGPIPFDFATATLRPEALPVLDSVAQILLDDPLLRVVVEGHTDTDGEPGFLFTLSRERAESVRAYIESRGVAPDRLAVIGFGGTRPLDTNTTPEGRARNRRIGFALMATPPR